MWGVRRLQGPPGTKDRIREVLARELPRFSKRPTPCASELECGRRERRPKAHERATRRISRGWGPRPGGESRDCRGRKLAAGDHTGECRDVDPNGAGESHPVADRRASHRRREQRSAYRETLVQWPAGLFASGLRLRRPGISPFGRAVGVRRRAESGRPGLRAPQARHQRLPLAGRRRYGTRAPGLDSPRLSPAALEWARLHLLGCIRPWYHGAAGIRRAPEGCRLGGGGALPTSQ